MRNDFEIDEEGFLILQCTERQDGCGLLTESCPFCGKKHLHGVGDGHRAAHCTVRPVQVTLPSGRVVSNQHGYILRKVV